MTASHEPSATLQLSSLEALNLTSRSCLWWNFHAIMGQIIWLVVRLIVLTEWSGGQMPVFRINERPC